MSINKNIETAILSIRLYSCLLVWFPSGILRVGFRISRVIGLGLGSCLDCGLSSISAQSRFVSAAGQRSPPGSSESPPCTSRCTSGTFLLVRLYICAFLFMCLYAGQRYPVNIQLYQVLIFERSKASKHSMKDHLKMMIALVWKRWHICCPPASQKKLSTSSQRFVRIFPVSGAGALNHLILNYLNLLTVRHPETS